MISVDKDLCPEQHFLIIAEREDDREKFLFRGGVVELRLVELLALVGNRTVILEDCSPQLKV